MINRKKINEFIDLRMKGKTYDEIVKRIGVSKPTLIKWSKVYKEEIEYTGMFLTRKLAEKIARNNEDMINIIAENLKRAYYNKKAPAAVKDRYIEKSFKRLGDVFKVRVKNIEITLGKNGDIKQVNINTKQ